eukprot:1456924-Amphidinium_carterae.1
MKAFEVILSECKTAGFTLLGLSYPNAPFSAVWSCKGVLPSELRSLWQVAHEGMIARQIRQGCHLRLLVNLVPSTKNTGAT